MNQDARTATRVTAGVTFRSSRTGTKRSVNAGPTRRAPSATSGFGPFIQQRRMPFFSSIVVMVAVVIDAERVVDGRTHDEPLGRSLGKRL